MAVVQTESGLVAIARPSLAGLLYESISLYDGGSATYEALYRTQPELKSTIDFIARNIAQIPLHGYRRVSDDERERISSGPLAETLAQPDLHSTRSKWLDSFVRDLCIYDAAYFLKVRGENGRIALVRIPPSTVEIVGDNWLRPESYKVHGSTGFVEYPAESIIDVHGYHPTDPRRGLSPIEGLRRLLAENAASALFREQYWKNAARVGGVIERPTTAPNWSDAARARFKQDFSAAYAGAAASGKTIVLEEGMQYKPVSFSAKDSQYLESVQLSREIVAATFGVPIGLLGLGSSTYASLSEQHRQLYSDCLAPWLVRIEQELERSLLPEFDDVSSVYLEFNLSAKLAGSFTETASVLQSAVGAPYMTRNEARSRLNLPRIEDGADDLVTPLNVLVGGLASPQDTVSTERQLALSAGGDGAKSIDAKALRKETVLRARARSRKLLQAQLEQAFERQRRSVISKLGAKSKSGAKASANQLYSKQRFIKELTEDMRPVASRVAETMAKTVGDWDPDNGEDYLDAVVSGFAESVADETYDRLDERLDESAPEEVVEEVDDLFDSLTDAMSAVYAASLVLGIGEWARNEAASANDIGSKTWLTTSGNPRSSHAALNGETVGRDETFSNGARWPGDPALDVLERANCECIVDWE